LYPTNAFDAATVEQWLDFAAYDIDLPASVWVFPILGLIPNNSTAVQKAKGDVRKVLENLNKHLLNRTFLVGNRITLADVAVALSLKQSFELVLDAAFRKGFQNTTRWFTTIVNQPEVKAVVGDVVLCEKMQVAKEAPKVEEEKKEVKKEEKKEQPKKEAKKVEKKDDDEEPEEDFEDKKPKGPNPLDLLPPSKFVLDEWKRTYSNNDTRTVAVPWLWENFDPTGYSFWFGEYKYNHELNKVFMTSNLCGGFLQRLEKLRKYGFASIIILGQEPQLKITTCFLVRGTEMPQEMKDVDDVEHYDWTKADTSDAAVKERINQFLAWDMPEFNQGKTFK